jgi:hypothetical protein
MAGRSPAAASIGPDAGIASLSTVARNSSIAEVPSLVSASTWAIRVMTPLARWFSAIAANSRPAAVPGSWCAAK